MEKLTIQEEEVMLYFWKLGDVVVREIVEAMPEPRPPYTSIASVARNLEKKGYLTPKKIGNTILYQIAIPENEYKKSFMGNVVSNYFTGSYKEMVSFFIRDRKISKNELKELIDIIEEEDKSKKGRK